MKRYLCFVLLVMIMLVSASDGAFAVVYGQAGYENQGYSESTAWEINSAAVLAKVRDDINKGVINYAAYYKLTEDIDLTDYDSWTSIGVATGEYGSIYENPAFIYNAFKGHFDGNGHTIKINTSDLVTERSWLYHGLFGMIFGGTIKNLTVQGNVEVYSRVEYSSGIFVGGIAAYLVNGSIENCKFDGKIIASNQGTYSHNVYAGGIVGKAGYSYHIFSINNCEVGSQSSTSITVSGSGVGDSLNAGGIVGYLDDHTYNNEACTIYGNYAKCSLTGKYTGEVYGARGRGEGRLSTGYITITKPSLASGTTGTSYSDTLTASKSGVTGTVEWSAEQLPSWLSLNKETGELSGTPSAEGEYTFNVTAELPLKLGLETVSIAREKTYTISVTKGTTPQPTSSLTITNTSLADGKTGTSYSESLKAAFSGNDVSSLVSWGISSGSLPAGLSLSAGTITGTPTTAGSYTFTITGTWGTFSGSREFTIKIAAGGIAVNAENFPDNTFRSYVSSNFDTNGDGLLSNAEIASVNIINVVRKGISSLKGIEHFTALTSLDCNANNKLTELDVSKNLALISLDCSGCALATLDVSNNTALTRLDCGANKLTTLDVSTNTALTELWCYSNDLTALDVSKNLALRELYCFYNKLTTLDLSKNTVLTKLECYSNELLTLDVSKNIALTNMDCCDNELITLDVSKNTALTKLDCGDNKLTTLDVSTNTALTELWCYSNDLTTLDISNNTALRELNCFYNQLTNLDLSKNTALRELYCYSNKLIELDLSHNTALTYLDVDGNQLTTLDVSRNTELTTLGCSGNKLTTLDVSKNTALTLYLGCANNQLTTLDLSRNTSLTQLDCSGNQLTTLNLSKNTALANLNCNNNKLTTLNVSKNTALSALNCSDNELTALDLRNNTALDYLDCRNNQLTDLDVSKNTWLGNLRCEGNSIAVIDITNCPDIENFTHDDETIVVDSDTELTINTSSLPDALSGTYYSTTLTANIPGAVWSASDLPAGLSLDETSGTLSGKPTLKGSYKFTVTASFAALSATKQFTLNINGSSSNPNDTPEIDDTVKPQFKNFSLMMEGQIGVNFYALLPEDSGITYTPENCWTTFDIRGDTSHTPQPMDYEFYKDIKGVRYYGFRCYINAAQMADTIKATLHYGNGQTITKEYSAKKYLNAALGTTGFSQTIINLMTAIKNYGHYIQPMLSKERDWVIGEKYLLMEAQTELTEEDLNSAQEALSEYAFSKRLNGSGVASVPYSLTLGSETTINLYITPSSSYTGSIAAYVDGSNVNRAVLDNGKYKVQISDIAAKDLGKMHTVRIVADAESTATISALSYPNAVFRTSASKIGKVDIETMRYAAAAIYNYYKAAKAYTDSL